MPPRGATSLICEADGGSARTGKLLPCEEGDEGYGKKTAKRGMPKRKKVTRGREIITMDTRAPGETEPRALEVMVPALSPPGERGRRMRTMVARSGRGQDTVLRGLGDMGSGLGRAFDKTFGKPHFWCADWKHVTDYIDAAAKVLIGLDTEEWNAQMRDSLRSKQMQDEGFPFISARAESQVRDRTRRRFGGPATWLEENLEPKATRHHPRRGMGSIRRLGAIRTYLGFPKTVHRPLPGSPASGADHQRGHGGRHRATDCPRTGLTSRGGR